MSSRTRIALQREVKHLETSGENQYLLEKLKKQYRYFGSDTCAADGLCSKSCPMGINVADLTHEIRRQYVRPSGYSIGTFAAEHFAGVKSALRGVLRIADLGHGILGSKAMSGIADAIHHCGAPLWTPSMPQAYKIPEKLHKDDDTELKVVYFPSCINQTMGCDKASSDLRPLAEQMVQLLHKAGYQVIFPEGMDALCCGTIWESKGMPDIADKKLKQLEKALLKATEGGRYPVVCDQSPCLHRMRQHMKGVKLYESAEFVCKFLKDRLVFKKTDEPVAIHLTCSTRLMNIDCHMIELAQLCSSSVLVPEGVGCCGFAGDKGMTHPQLNAYALRKLSSQIKDHGIKTGYSNSRTCEIGLQNNSGIPYRSIIYLVNECTSAKEY